MKSLHLFLLRIFQKENEVPEKEEDFEKHESVSMINTDSNIHTSQNGANTDSTKKKLNWIQMRF